MYVMHFLGFCTLPVRNVIGFPHIRGIKTSIINFTIVNIKQNKAADALISELHSIYLSKSMLKNLLVQLNTIKNNNEGRLEHDGELIRRV